MQAGFGPSFFRERNYEASCTVQKAHDQLRCSREHIFFKKAVVHSEDAIKVATAHISDLYARAQQDHSALSLDEMRLLDALCNTVKIVVCTKTETSEQMRLSTLAPSCFPSIYAQQLRSLVSDLSKQTRFEYVAEAAANIKEQWRALYCHQRNMKIKTDALNACKMQWRVARKAPPRTLAQFERMRPRPNHRHRHYKTVHKTAHKGIHHSFRGCPRWVQDRGDGLSQEQADAACKARIQKVAQRNGL